MIRIGLRGIPPFSGVALRFAVAAAVLFGYARWRGIPMGRSNRERWLWLANGLLSFAISYGAVYWGEQWIPSGLAAVLFATFPLFVVLLAHLLLPRERMTARTAAGVLVGLGGTAAIFSKDLGTLGGGPVLLGAAVLLLAPFSSAAGSVLVKRWGEGLHPVSLTAVPMALTAILMGAVALVWERDRTLSFDAVSVGALLYLAVLGSAVTFTLYYWLLAHATATQTSLLAYTIPIVAVAVGAVFLDEPFPPGFIVGSSLIVGGVALATHPRPRASPERTPPPG